MKRTIHLKESELKNIIAETVKRFICEGGHLYWQDDNGTIYTNSKEKYRGVPGTTLVWHGENADSEIFYKGESINFNDVEDSLWYQYKEDCEERNEQPTEQGYEEWIEEVGTGYIAATLDDFLVN